MNRLFRWLVTAALTLLTAVAATPARAGGGPENVFLVVNPNSPESLAIANHWIALREIPAGNVCYIPWAPRAYRTSGTEFRDKLLKPLLKEIDARGLGGQIDCIAYSAGFPWQINFEDIHGKEKHGTPFSPAASLTGATYLYQFILGDREEFTALNTNFYFAKTTDGKTESRAFHGFLGWQPDGAAGREGIRYLMSTMLGVTTGAGTTVDETVQYLTRAAGADGTRPPGAFYYMINGKNPRSTARHDGFAAAAAELEALGREAIVENGVVPRGSDEVLGLTCGSHVVPLASSGSRLQPGAIVDNLTSAGGQLTARKPGKGQTPLTDYLRHGAAGASGTVVEPYAIAQKFPSPALHVHYARGCSLAEAFYQSVQGPFQLLVVGDPLCQPWVVRGQVELTLPGLTGTLSGTVNLQPTVAWPDGRQTARTELFVDGVRRAAVRGAGPLELDTTKLGDGYHRLTVAAVDNTPIEAQCRWSDWVVVKNGRDALAISTPGGSQASGEELELTMTSTRDADTIISHNGRELARVAGGSGTVRVKTADLGAGPVLIEGRTDEQRPLTARPLPIHVDGGR